MKATARRVIVMEGDTTVLDITAKNIVIVAESDSTETGIGLRVFRNGSPTILYHMTTRVAQQLEESYPDIEKDLLREMILRHRIGNGLFQSIIDASETPEDAKAKIREALENK